MRRPFVLPSVVLALVVGSFGSAAVGQDASPPAGFEIAPGVTAEALAFAAGQEAPSLYRLTFAPGVVYRVEPAPEISLVYQETGALNATLDAPITITRAGETDAAGESIAADAAFALGAGDYAVFPPLVGGEVRNDGTSAASVVVAAIVPAGMGLPTAATPAP